MYKWRERFGRAIGRELAVVGVPAALFLALLLGVLHGAPTAADRELGPWIQSIPWGEWAFVPRLGSDVGGGAYGYYLVPAVVAGYFALTRQWKLVGLLAVVFALHYVFIVPKLLIDAPRPAPEFGVSGGGGLESFPSGHVQWAVSFYGLMTYLAWRRAGRPTRAAIAVTYGVVVVMTMLGRIELGRHWPLDTVAGALVGLLALRVVVALHSVVERRPWAKAEPADIVSRSHTDTAPTPAGGSAPVSVG